METSFNSLKSLACILAISIFAISCEDNVDSVAPATALGVNATQDVKSADTRADQEFDREMQQVINSMMKQMNQMEMTCDPDVDFANMMIMHHEMGIKMADIELKYGHEPEAKELAVKTKEGNLASKERLQAFLAYHFTPEPLSKEQCRLFMMEMKEGMRRMMQCMKQLRDTPDPDVDFANLMICHHQGAIAMSNTELKWGDDEAALEEAKTIIEEQSQEIIELSEFINEHGVPTKKNS